MADETGRGREERVALCGAATYVGFHATTHHGVNTVGLAPGHTTQLEETLTLQSRKPAEGALRRCARRPPSRAVPYATRVLPALLSLSSLRQWLGVSLDTYVVAHEHLSAFLDDVTFDQRGDHLRHEPGEQSITSTRSGPATHTRKKGHLLFSWQSPRQKIFL